MLSFEVPNAYAGYPVLLRDVVEFGIDRLSPVGEIREVENVTISFDRGANTLTPPRAGSAPLLGLLGATQLLSGFSAHELTAELYPKVAEHPDFLRPFAFRHAQQIDNAFHTLHDARGSNVVREVVMTWWHAYDDLKDTYTSPSMTTIVFRLRDGVLDMVVHARATDLWLCAPADFVQFGLIQETFATALGYASGSYTHHFSSLYIQEQHVDKAEFSCSMMTHPSYLGRHRPVRILPLAKPGWDLSKVVAEAHQAQTGGDQVETPAGYDIQTRISARLTTVQAPAA